MGAEAQRWTWSMKRARGGSCGCASRSSCSRRCCRCSIRRSRRWSICSATWAATGSSSTSAIRPGCSEYYDYHWAAIGNLGVDLLVHPARPADRARARGEADRARDPAADRDRLPVGRARSARAGAADRFLRAAVHLRLSVPVRLREFRAFGGAGVSCLRSMAAAWAASSARGCGAGCSSRSRSIVFFAHTYGWGLLGLMCFSADAVRLHDRGRGVVASRDRGGAAHIGHGAADPRDAGLAQRNARRPDRSTGSTGRSNGAGFMPRCATAGSGSTSARWSSPALVFVYAIVSRQADAVAQPRLLGDRACASPSSSSRGSCSARPMRTCGWCPI